MSLKSLVGVMMLSVLAASATASSAQDWWNPGRWTSHRPYSGYSTRYGSGPCANGVCRPSYATGYYHEKGNAGWSGYRSPTYEPDYRRDRSDKYGDWETYYRTPQSSRSRYNPFYE